MILYFQFVITSVLASPVIRPENVFSSGHLFYRKMLLVQQSGALYVGANGHLFKLWAYNINDTSTDKAYGHVELAITQEDIEECRENGNVECENGVRLLLMKKNKQILLVCSSGGVRPRIYYVDAVSLEHRSLPENVIGICSPDPRINTTATLVEVGNPDDIPSLYSGIRTGLSFENDLIYRPPLAVNKKEIHSSMRTVYTDYRWLNDPQFVASMDIGKYVYFIFREVAVEYENCGRAVYSRIARICKKDIGGRNVLRQVWTSFVKARLNCSLVSDFPLYFDEIQAVELVSTQTDTHFYATFNTPNTQYGGSAICLFTLSAVNQLFDQGMFLEHSDFGDIWTVTHPDHVPTYRPGSCSSDSMFISDEDLHFAKTHLLMAGAVSSETVITLPNEQLTHIAVDVIGNVNVIFSYSHSSGKIFKIVYQLDGASPRSMLLTSYTIAQSGTVFSLALLPGEFLYLSNEWEVAQYDVSQCDIYTSCYQCARDPYCSWNIASATCSKKDVSHITAVGWITQLGFNANICADNVQHISLRVYPGDAVHLKCSSSSSFWYFNDIPLKESDNCQLTTHGGAILLN
ncbi:hypothetical protein AB6A40_003872 [Gnathostoma spinigerum]|uniref:Sema domain-containing protein n=1 Tax=Gnathostoma spinigerum TaxID=75299 RepID=A0ABD6EAZ7_9BILA